LIYLLINYNEVTIGLHEPR